MTRAFLKDTFSLSFILLFLSPVLLQASDVTPVVFSEARYSYEQQSNKLPHAADLALKP